MQLHKTLAITLLSLLLFACGGSLDGTTTTDTTTPTDTKDTTDTGETVSVPVDVTTRLLYCPSGWNKDITQCTDTTEISALKPGVVAVSLSQNGVALSRELVTGSVSKGTLTPGEVLTNSSGVAFFNLVASDGEGAGRITVTTDAAEQETEDTLNFEVGASNVAIAIENDTAGLSLAQNSTALITVNLTTDEGAYTSPVTVTFSSACATAGTSKLDESVTAINGVAQATYQPIGCVGDDLITANAEINSLSASTTVSVASSPADSISFVSATPVNIAIKGTGGAGRQETSKVLFKVVDQYGSASSLQDVEFKLDHAPLGTTIDPLIAKTNAAGEVYTLVSSGKVAGPVKVKVKLSDPSLFISSVSSELVVSTGLPDQKSFSVALENFSPEVLEYDGVKVGVTVQLADHYNNAVPDGTAVFFNAEAGAINDLQAGQVGSCLTKGNSCSVNWVSGGEEPAGNKLNSQGLLYGCARSDFYDFAPCTTSYGMGQPYGGRVTITAYTVGEENFVDRNNDGEFTPGEPFTDDNCDGTYTFNEPFDDSDNNGIYTPAEPFIDSDGNGLYTVKESYIDSDGNGVYTPAESFTDANGDGIYNKAELFTDSNGDGFYTSAEPYTDSNGDGQYTVAEAFADSNGNGSYDAVAEDYVDSDGNGKYTAEESFTDNDGDGEYTSPESYVDVNQIVRLDILANAIVYNAATDGKYTPAEPYTDSNGDGNYSGSEAYIDQNSNGQYDIGEVFVDRDKNGTYTAYAGVDEPYTDTNGNNIYDMGESFADADNNGKYSPGDAYQDSNNDGHFTLAESYTDSDGNGAYTYAEVFTDSNGNGAYDIAEPFTDSNSDGIFTDAELYTDSNGDGLYTSAEAYTDSNGDGEYTGAAEAFVDKNGDGVYTGIAEAYIDTDGNGMYSYAETFTDTDGNGQYTVRDTFDDVNGDNKYTGDTFNDRAELFYDHNEDGLFKANKKCDIRQDLEDDLSVVGADEEESSDFNQDGEYSFGNKLFNGMLCSESNADAGLCERELIHVSDNITLIMASKGQYMRVQNRGVDANHADLTTATGSSGVSLQVYIADIYNNRPPAKSVITIKTDNGVLGSDATLTVPSSNAYGPYAFPVLLTREAEPNKKASGSLTITITTPRGTITTYNIGVSDDG